MKKHIVKALSIGMLTAAALSSCSDQFLQDKKNYDNVSVDIYNNFDGANTRLNDLYAWSLPDVNSDATWKTNTTGSNDGQGKCTEEYSGFGDFVDPESKLLSMSSPQVPDYFHNQGNNIQASVWGRIRNINDFIDGVQNGTLSNAEKDRLIAQAQFLRAWCYYQMVKWYGGIPIITKVLDPVPGNFTPRSSAKKCFEFMIGDLNDCAQKLGTTKWGDSDWGHVDAAAALALKGRLLNLWASPMFNRKNDTKRWETAYDEQKKDIETIKKLGYRLYQSTSDVNASSFAAVFSKIRSEEALFVVLHNTSTLDDGKKNNGWENSIRPRNIGGSGGKEASAMLVDLFPMANGKVPATADTYTKLAHDSIYESDYPFLNRDPRFYRTFAFPGVRWASAGSTADVGKTGDYLPPYPGGYELWNYVWYVSESDAGNPESGNCYAADSLLTYKKGVFVRKRSIDADVSDAEALYAWAADNAKYNSGKGYALSAAPYIEIRFAEVLLNLAEAAAGANKLDEAVGYLKEIRMRAGYTGNCGFEDNLTSDQAACMSAVLYERQVELAYEGKRFDDCRRWMLYDGGAKKVEGAPSTWTLTGWGGNTCTWLGFKPLNGQRRENMQFRTADKFGVGTEKAESDPLLKAKKGGDTQCKRCDAVDFRKELAPQLEALRQWYSYNLVRKTTKGDGRDSQHNDLYISFEPYYYFLGFTSGAQNANKDLPQTIGWQDYNNGGSAGTFDPLSE